MKPRFNRHLLPSAVFFVLASPAFAATWIGTDNLANNWNTAANWNPVAVPGNTTEVIIGTGATVNLSGGLNRAANTTLSGSLTISSNLNNNNGTNTNSIFTVNSGAAFTQTGGNYFIGAANGGTGTTTFNQAGGTVLVTALRGFQLSDGSGAGRTGTYNINAGNFTATVANDGIGEIYNGFLAGRAGGTTPDSFNVAGGTAIIQVPVTALTRRLTLTNGASVNVSSGSLAFNGFAENRLGYDDGNIAGTSGTPANAAASKLTVSGTGALTVAMAGTNPFFDIGATPGYNGAIEVSGTSVLNITGGGLSIGSNGANGNVTLTSGSMTANQFINIGRKDSNTSGGTDVHLNLNGGILSTSSIRSGGGTISSTNNNVVANGGTIKALADEADFLRIGVNGATPLNTVRPYVKIESGGLTFDTNGHNVGIQTGLYAGDTSGGGLTKIGLGTLSLSGANDYTGATNVSTGTLQVATGGSIAGACTMAGGTTLAVGGSPAGTWTVPDLNLSNTSSVSILNFDALSFSGPAIWATNSLVPTGTVPVSVPGVLAVGDFPLIGYPTGGSIGGAGIGAFQLTALPRGVVASLIDSNEAVTLHVEAINPLVWMGNAGAAWDINSTVNWSLSGSPDKYQENDNLLFNDTLTGSTTVTLATDVHPANVTFDNTDYDYTVNGSGAIAGTTGLTKTGDGMLTLASSNTYTGTTTVSGGTLRFGDGLTDGSLAGPLVANGMNVIFNTTGTSLISGSIDGYSDSSQLTKTGPGTLVLTSAVNTFNGTFAINQGMVAVGNGTTNGTLGSFCTFDTSSGTTLRLNQATAGTINWPKITGLGTLSLNSAQAVNASAGWGTPTLQPAFTGTLKVEKGRVDLSSGTTGLGGTSLIQIQSGAQLLCFESASPYNMPIEIAGNGWGEAGYPGGIRLAADRTATWSGAVTLTANAVIMAQRGSNFTVSGPISGAYQCEFYAGDAHITLGDSGNLTVAPAAPVQNSYTSTKINGRPNASVIAGNSHAFSSGPLEVAGAIFKLNGNNLTFANLSGAGGAIGNYSNSTPATLAAGDGSSTTFAGVLRDGGTSTLSLVKNGAGTLTLTGANTYTGNTTVNAGTLSINSAFLADGSTVSIASGAQINLNTGIAEDTVAALVLGEVTVPPGTYNSLHATYGSYFTGTGSIVIVGGYDAWAPDAGLTASNDGLTDDAENDGIDNLMEFYLDGNPLASDPSILPASSLDDDYLTLTFTRRDDAEEDVTSQAIQYGSDLAGWTDVPLGEVSAGPDVNGVIVTVDENGTDPDDITVQIPREVEDDTMFARLKIAK
ncbi:MAG: autotransporter-associated beta strand repeat-containing protein [Verrucomicrobiota bacterium]